MEKKSNSFLIVFFLIFIGGIASITYLSNVVNDNHIHSEVINITNKTDNSTSVNDYFIVKTANGWCVILFVSKSIMIKSMLKQASVN